MIMVKKGGSASDPLGMVPVIIKQQSPKQKQFEKQLQLLQKKHVEHVQKKLAEQQASRWKIYLALAILSALLVAIIAVPVWFLVGLPLLSGGGG